MNRGDFKQSLEKLIYAEAKATPTHKQHSPVNSPRSAMHDFLMSLYRYAVSELMRTRMRECTVRRYDNPVTSFPPERKIWWAGNNW
jgi:hypothetical protein